MFQPELNRPSTALRAMNQLVNIVRARSTNPRTTNITPVELETAELSTFAASLISSEAAVRSRAIYLVPRIKNLEAVGDEIARALLNTDVEREKLVLIGAVGLVIGQRQSFAVYKCLASDCLQPQSVRRAAVAKILAPECNNNQKGELFESLIKDPTARPLISRVLAAINCIPEASLSHPALKRYFDDPDVFIVAGCMKLRGEFLLGRNRSFQSPFAAALLKSFPSSKMHELEARIRGQLHSRDFARTTSALQIACASTTLAVHLEPRIRSMPSSSRFGDLSPSMVIHPDIHFFAAIICDFPGLLQTNVTTLRPSSYSKWLKISAIGMACLSRSAPLDPADCDDSRESSFPPAPCDVARFWSDLGLLDQVPAHFHLEYVKRFEGGMKGGPKLASEFDRALTLLSMTGHFEVDGFEGIKKCFDGIDPSVRNHAAALLIALGNRCRGGDQLSLLYPSGSNAVERAFKAILMTKFQPGHSDTLSLVRKSLLSQAKGELVAGLWCAELLGAAASDLRAEVTLAGLSGVAEIAQRARAVLSTAAIHVDSADSGEEFFAFKKIA